MLEGAKERAGRNEAIFREVNENISKLEDRLDSGSDSLPVICECAQADCVEQIEIPLEDYRSVRQHPDWFIVAPGHELLNVEQVIDRRDGYVIVEKLGVAKAAADAAS